MVAKLFILGLPGSGKSAVFRHINDYLLQRYHCSTRRFNDYKILQMMFNSDTDQQFKPAVSGGFDVLDLQAFDIALRRLEQVVSEYLPNAREDAVIIIEFSRNDYRRAFSLFQESFLKDAFFLHLDTEVDICKKRITKRVAEHVYDDDYPVSDFIFEKYYHSDDGQNLHNILAKYQIDRSHVLSIKNNGTLEVISPSIDLFVDSFAQLGSLLAPSYLI